jgi:DtxR family Mn-dependent transcriptional regulator
MCAVGQNLSSGLEDYIEAIYIAHLHQIPLKGAELARKLNISRASVSEALAKLVAKELIKYSSYEAITLTQKGIDEAKKVYAKHHTLKEFFETVLLVQPDEAGENACKIEHIVSGNILKKMTKLTKLVKQYTEISDKIKEELLK